MYLVNVIPEKNRAH